MARLTAFSVGGSRAFPRNRAIDPSFNIWTAYIILNYTKMSKSIPLKRLIKKTGDIINIRI